MPHIENYDHCLRFQVLDKIISFIDGAAAEVVADNRGCICISIEFDEQWDGIGKTARFIYNKQWVDVPLNTDGECICPSEVLKKGRFSLGVYGAELKTTTPIVVNVKESILSESEGELPADPTPGEYEQIIQLYTATCEAADAAMKQMAEAIEELQASSELFVESKEELEEGGFITGIKEKNKGNVLSFWVGTTEEYEALPEPPQNCYVILSDDKTLATILEKISALEKDYVVEQGEVTIKIVTGFFGESIKWIYRRWSNGIVECWGTTEPFNLSGYMYNFINLPFRLSFAPTNITYGILVNKPYESDDETSNKIRVVTRYSTETNIQPYIASEKSFTGVQLSIHVIGRWK